MAEIIATQTPGAYLIVNTSNQNYYIGSSVRCRTRLLRHFRELRNGRHCNQHLQAAFTKYGESCFVGIQVVFSQSSNLVSEEQRLIDGSNKERIYNVLHKIERKELPDSVKEKISAKLKGRTIPDEVKAKISKGLQGRVFSADHKRKIGDKSRERMKGSKLSAETRQKLSESRRGRKLSEDHKAAILAANKRNSKGQFYKQ